MENKASGEETRSKWLIRPNLEYQSQRLKFGFGRANREKYFTDLTRYNARLKELLDTSDKSMAIRESRQRVKHSLISKLIWKIWAHAATLHSLLNQAWCCQCKHLHRMRLQLHHRLDIEAIEYDLCFIYASQPSSGMSPWRWKATNARRLEQELSEQSISLKVLVSPGSQSPVTLSSPISGPKSAMRAGGRRQLPTRPKVNFPDSASTSHTSTSLDAQKSAIISDLCSSIALCHPSTDDLGLLQGEADSYILQKASRVSGDLSDCVTLGSLLDGSAGIRLDRRQRIDVAFTIAASHLQLYPSPWLQSHWSKKDIVFPKEPGQRSSVLIEQAYMMHDFPAANVADSNVK